FTATTFLVTDFVGRFNTWDVRYTWRRLPHLDWDAIARWRGRGLDFASHTASHARLTWLSDERAADELGRSRETLLRRLGPDAGRAVAYPFGARDQRVERLARAGGYAVGFAGGRAHGPPLRSLRSGRSTATVTPAGPATRARWSTIPRGTNTRSPAPAPTCGSTVTTSISYGSACGATSSSRRGRSSRAPESSRIASSG